MWSGGVGIRMASVRDRWRVELVDVEDNVRANRDDRLGGAVKSDRCAIVISVGSPLGTSVVAIVCRSGVLGEMFNLHCRHEKIFDVSGKFGFGWCVGWSICLVVVSLMG